MEHRTVRDILQLVSKDKLYADFVDIDSTKVNPNGYGYYDIWHSSIGSFMICYDKNTIFNLCAPDIDFYGETSGYISDDGKQDSNYAMAVKFLSNLKVRPSAMSLNEMKDKFEWVLASPETRAKKRQHYVNACVISDLIDERLELGSRATKYSTIPGGGIRITTHFPFSGVETMNLYRTEIPNVRDSFNNPLITIKVEIPAAGFVDTFSSMASSYKDKMAYDQADKFIRLTKKQEPMSPRNEEFGRFASDYRRTMLQIKRVRQK